ncbi:hypothetical protein [Flavobacterium branchiicola]|nr:hypothetical protein [Flavobacterium branchiicola]MBS7255749.1 hypothetical protein [Flavobacterium branchiicola]
MNSNRHHPILIDLLRKKGIHFAISPETDNSSYWYSNDTVFYHLTTNCYYKAFNELLNSKYGSNFTQKIERTADSLYVISRIDTPFEYPNGVDNYCKIYPKAEDFLDQKKEILYDFLKNFKFPKGFIQTSSQDFFAKTNFIIKRNSKISALNIEIKFTNPENQKFKENIFTQIKMFIENANWQAAVSSGVKVDCLFNINFYN